jgi:multiple sugar transport system substrate-binding protein
MIDLTYYLRARGVSMYNPEGTELGYQDDQIMADYLRTQQKWTDEGLIYTGGSVSNNKSHPLVTGLTAFYPVVTNQAATISSFTSDSLKLFHYPVVDPKVEGKFLRPSMFLSVSAFSKHKEVAAQFISFFMNDPEANDILNGERGVPVVSKIAGRLFAKQDAANQEQYLYIEKLKTQVKPIDPPVPSSSTSLNNALTRIKNKVFAGTVSPEEGAAEYRIEAAKILNRGRAE